MQALCFSMFDLQIFFISLWLFFHAFYHFFTFIYVRVCVCVPFHHVGVGLELRWSGLSALLPLESSCSPSFHP